MTFNYTRRIVFGLLCAFLLVPLLAGSSSASSAAPAQTGSATINIKVVDLAGAGVQGVNADLFSEGRAKWLNWKTTGSSGTASFQVNAGCYVVTLIAPSNTGFSSGRYSNHPICVTSGNSGTVKNTLLINGSSPTGIEGTIVNKAGTAEPGIAIELFTSNNGSRGNYLKYAKTDSKGDFSFTVSAGCYVVTFVAPSGVTWVEQAVRYMNREVCVQSGKLAKADAVLNRGDGGGSGNGILTGTISDPDGPVAKTSVDLFKANSDGSRGSWVNYAIPSSNGSFTFTTNPGCYVLTYVAPDGRKWSANGSRWWNRSVCVSAGQTKSGLNASLTGTGGGGSTVKVLAAGDLGDCSLSHPNAVGAYVESRTDTTFMALGDIVYPNATTANLNNCYNPHFKDAKSRTLPVIGNHDIEVSNGQPYSSYFGSSTGPDGKFWYSTNLGNWHIIVLNSDCAKVGGCGTSSPQYQWLANDLANNNKACTLVAWHHAYVSSEADYDATWMKPFYQLLDEKGADILLAAHSHSYERFDKMNANRAVDSNGIRAFVVGTGGTYQKPFTQSETGSAVRKTGTWGVLELTLNNGSYSWKFIRTSGSQFSDSGSSSC